MVSTGLGKGIRFQGKPLGDLENGKGEDADGEGGPHQKVPNSTTPSCFTLWAKNRGYEPRIPSCAIWPFLTNPSCFSLSVKNRGSKPRIPNFASWTFLTIPFCISPLTKNKGSEPCTPDCEIWAFLTNSSCFFRWGKHRGSPFLFQGGKQEGIFKNVQILPRGTRR